MTPALERLLNIASQARNFIAHEHGPVPLVYELGEAIREVEAEQEKAARITALKDAREREVKARRRENEE